jgi:uncharacterized protein (TIGR02246 family)
MERLRKRSRGTWATLVEDVHAAMVGGIDPEALRDRLVDGADGHRDGDDEPRAENDEVQIRALHQRLLDGWNQGSGEAFAAPFAEDAHLVAFDGSILRGRKQIAEVQQRLFDRWLRGTRLVGGDTRVRFLGPDAAVALTVGGTIMRGKSKPAPERDSIQTLVAQRGADGWSFVSFQNTRLRPIGASAVSTLLWPIPDKL